MKPRFFSAQSGAPWILLFAISTAACSFSSSTDSGSAGATPPAGSTRSETVPTKSILVGFSAQDYGDGTGIHAYASLAGPDRTLSLSGNDTLDARIGDTVVPMTLEGGEAAGIVRYTCILPEQPGDATVAIELHRTVDVSATASTTVVGAPFTLVSPPASVSAKKYTIALSPASSMPPLNNGESWQITASGTCISGFSALSALDTIFDDDGNLILDFSTLTAPDQKGPPTTSCPLTISIRHEHYGPVDPALEGAIPDFSELYDNAPVDSRLDVEGLQARSWNISFTPGAP